MGRLLRIALSLVSLGAFVVACESPTLPLPPPEIPEISSAGLPAGQVKLSSVDGALPDAIIVIFNDNPKLPGDKRVSGAQADGNGSWDAIVFASPGDSVEITQQPEQDLETSPSIIVQIQ
jgi:hypothetical protein